jgi:hypothetical protein
MQIDESDGQARNADFSSRASLESDSNATIERSRHSQKQCPQMISTEEGMQIDASDGQ